MEGKLFLNCIIKVLKYFIINGNVWNHETSAAGIHLGMGIFLYVYIKMSRWSIVLVAHCTFPWCVVGIDVVSLSGQSLCLVNSKQLWTSGTLREKYKCFWIRFRIINIIHIKLCYLFAFISFKYTLNNEKKYKDHVHLSNLAMKIYLILLTIACEFVMCSRHEKWVCSSKKAITCDGFRSLSLSIQW